MAINNPYAKYKSNAINTASKEELTLMLYNGALKFANQASIAIEKKDYMKANELIQRVKAIIRELQISLNKDYEIAQQLDLMYDYIFRLLTKANVRKDINVLDEATGLIRELRDTWKEAMKLARAGK